MNVTMLGIIYRLSSAVMCSSKQGAISIVRYWHPVVENSLYLVFVYDYAPIYQENASILFLKTLSF